MEIISVITVRLKNALLLSFAVSKRLIVNGDHWMMQSISACNTSLLSSRSLRYLFGIHFLTSSRDEESDRVRRGSASAYTFQRTREICRTSVSLRRNAKRVHILVKPTRPDVRHQSPPQYRRAHLSATPCRFRRSG